MYVDVDSRGRYAVHDMGAVEMNILICALEKYRQTAKKIDNDKSDKSKRRRDNRTRAAGMIALLRQIRWSNK